MHMSESFDVVVLGSGSAAQSVASRCRKAGWTVAMIDKRPFGGTCALRGCDPKKVLVGAAAAIDGARLLSGKGVRPDDLAIDWQDLIRFKRTFTDPYSERLDRKLSRDGIEAIRGAARFVDPTHVEVGRSVLRAKRAIVIATGARPANLPFDGRQHAITSEQFLDLPSLPASIAFIGGGYISFEFAHVAARAGARVTILHRDNRPLAAFDAALVKRLVARTQTLGIEVRLTAEVKGVRAVDRGYELIVSQSGEPDTVDAALVVHGAGRVPDLDGLALDAGNVNYSAGGITVNAFLQSVSNPLVYAAGDCADTIGPPLTPVAGYEGRIVAANLLDGNHATPTYDAIPSVVFTTPPLARVGLTEDEARAKGIAFSLHEEDSSMWYSSRRVGETHSGFKVLVESTTGHILGAHLLGPHADETINLFTLAIRAGVTADQLKNTLWAYPTVGADSSYMV
jgi:glutathione reductase (NADPH)